MEIMRAKLMSLSVYKNILETEPVQALLRLTQAKTADGLIQCYTELVYSVWNAGFSTLPECIAWHLKYDESFIGNAIAAGTAPDYMKDAAAMDIRRLASVSMLSCAGLKRNIGAACAKFGDEFASIIQNLAELPMGESFDEEDIFESYRKNGCGRFALGRAFHWEKGQLTQVKHSDPIDQKDMIGYEFQRNAVIENTRVMLSGKPTNNVLLYGDSGTGKSATVKSLVNIPEFYNLRLIEIAKNSLDELTELIRTISHHTQKFIIYIDDLSFEQEDKGFSALKTALEGGPGAPSGQRGHLCDLQPAAYDPGELLRRQGDDVHARETLEERTSLSERFGLRLSYLALDKKRYQDMVLSLCHRMNLTIPDSQILVEANRWEIQHGSRTPRVAVQLVEKLAGETADC